MRFGQRPLVAVTTLFVAACSSSTPSPQSWRVVRDSQGRLDAPIVIATDASSLERIAGGLATDVDLGSEVAIGLALGGPPGCEDRVVAIDIAASDRLVEPVVRLPEGPCGSVAIARVVVVAVQRSALPAAPFTVRTRFTNCSEGCTGSSVSVSSIVEGDAVATAMGS